MLEDLLRLSTLGAIHTAISLVALGAGVYALARYRQISPRRPSGVLYAMMTVLTCLTGFGIFRNGGISPGHILGVLTLLVLALATLADKTPLLGRAGYYIVPLAYSTTFFFHWVPAVNETSTRLPIGAPWATGPEDPKLRAALAVVFLLFLIGFGLQVRGLRKRRPKNESTIGVLISQPAEEGVE